MRKRKSKQKMVINLPSWPQLHGNIMPGPVENLRKTQGTTVIFSILSNLLTLMKNRVYFKTINFSTLCAELCTLQRHSRGPQFGLRPVQCRFYIIGFLLAMLRPGIAVGGLIGRVKGCYNLWLWQPGTLCDHEPGVSHGWGQAGLSSSGLGHHRFKPHKVPPGICSYS